MAWKESRSTCFCWGFLKTSVETQLISVHGRSQHTSSRTGSEGSPKMFFPTGKLIGSSRLLCCWLEASGGRRASQSQHKATSAGGRCHRLSARWSMLKGSLLSGEGNELEKPSTAKSALSPLGKKKPQQNNNEAAACLQRHHADLQRQSWGCSSNCDLLYQ